MDFHASFKRLIDALPSLLSTAAGSEMTISYDLVMSSAKDLRSADGLARAYIEATEWNFATLAGFVMVKRTPKHELRRQIGICVKMLTVCLDLKGTELAHASRVKAALKRIEAGMNPEQSVQAFIDNEGDD